MDFIRSRFTIGIEATLGEMRTSAAVMRGDQVHCQVENIVIDRLSCIVELLTSLERLGELAE